jgi:hypothetical protein
MTLKYHTNKESNWPHIMAVLKQNFDSIPVEERLPPEQTFEQYARQWVAAKRAAGSLTSIAEVAMDAQLIRAGYGPEHVKKLEANSG